MAVEVIAGTPLADELQKSVQPKLVEMGWSTGAADDSALSEYIILMLVNGKTQEEVASDLASDLLGLDSEDQSAAAFAKWLFEEVNRLGGGSEAQTQPHTAIPDVQHPEMEQMDTAGTDGTPAAQDMNMGEGGPPGTAYVSTSAPEESPLKKKTDQPAQSRCETEMEMAFNHRATVGCSVNSTKPWIGPATLHYIGYGVRRAQEG